MYFPDDEMERKRLPKAWICNILSTITEGAFDQWVKRQIDIRNVKRATQADKLIEVDADIYTAFQNATSISCKYLLILFLVRVPQFLLFRF